MMDRTPCPCCNHQHVRKLYKKAILEADAARVEQEKAAKQVIWDAKAPSARSSKPPRSGKGKVQEYYCVCFQLSIDCMCSVGPFKDSMREDLAGQFQDFQNGVDEEPRPTTSDNAGLFLNTLVEGSIQMADRDIREANLQRSTDTIQGAAVDYVNHSVIDDNDKFAVGNAMGVPTTLMPNGTDIEHYQKKSVGKRFYSGGLSRVGGQPNDMISQAASGSQDAAWTNYDLTHGSAHPNNAHLKRPNAGLSSTSRSNRNNQQRSITPRREAITPRREENNDGVSIHRSKKRLRESITKGTPTGARAAEAILDNLANHVDNSSTHTLYDAEDDSELEVEPDYTRSQTVVRTAIVLKKLEIERKS